MRRLVFSSLLLAACGPRVSAPHGNTPELSPPQQARDAGTTAPRTTDGGVVIAPPIRPPAPPKPAKVKLTIKSAPPKSWVWWGKQKLGQTPVQLERPRDSGPVDIVVRNDGFLTLHTRLYTFRSETLVVKLVKLADKMTVLGARAEPPPETPPDGGAPPAPAE